MVVGANHVTVFNTFDDMKYADAMLIAAAPDMLTALKALLQFNEELCEDVGVSKHYPSAEKARAAIAKAEDRS